MGRFSSQSSGDRFRVVHSGGLLIGGRCMELDSQEHPSRMNYATVHCLVFDGFADWEPSFALAELRRSGGLRVTSVGFTASPVSSMGGLRILPDRTLTGIRAQD